MNIDENIQRKTEKNGQSDRFIALGVHHRVFLIALMLKCYTVLKNGRYDLLGCGLNPQEGWFVVNFRKIIHL